MRNWEWPTLSKAGLIPNSSLRISHSLITFRVHCNI